MGIIAVIWLLPGTELHLIGVIISVVFGFFFVVVAARIVGIVGSSSSPVSGMTIATLLVTCLVLVYFGVSGVKGMVTAMSVGTIVCIAVCISGDIAQDLKTGYLLGATPWKQQLTEFIGLFFPAIAMGFTVFFLNDAFGFVQIEGSNRTPLLAPQANVMATLVQGVMNSSLPWLPIIVGGMVALSIELLGVSSLPFAIGLYLPLSLSTPIMTGGLISLLINKYAKEDTQKSKNENGILFSSGLVAGDALVSVVVAFMIGTWFTYEHYYDLHDGMMRTITGSFGPWLSLIFFFCLALVMGYLAWHGNIKKR
jgi:putative OPT family oligopeptide transporter